MDPRNVVSHAHGTGYVGHAGAAKAGKHDDDDMYMLDGDDQNRHDAIERVIEQQFHNCNVVGLPASAKIYVFVTLALLCANLGIAIAILCVVG